MATYAKKVQTIGFRILLFMILSDRLPSHDDDGDDCRRSANIV